MGIIKKTTVILVGIVVVSCGIMKDDMIGLNQQDYLGNSLRLEGYYYNEFPSNVPRIDIYFFYKNGIALYGEAPSLSNLSIHEEKFRSGEYYYRKKSNRTGWGVFQITGSSIEFETWEPSNGGRLRTVVRSGEILNDTTFLINSFFNNYSDKTSVKNDTFYFREFSPKPDSTNMFIE